MVVVPNQTAFCAIYLLLLDNRDLNANLGWYNLKPGTNQMFLQCS